jgi:HD superfamily phosphohydrolase YqeK
VLEEEFDKYAKKYDLNDLKLKSRYNHSYRVMDLCVKYATELGWSKDDIELAKIIGLLHDFGRFEQWKVYHSFIDKNTVDHADYSVEQLFDKNEIIKFTNRKEDYELIKFAIKNHNKLEIEKCDNERFIKFAKLIRDADKVDIIYLLGYGSEIKEKGTNEKITDKVMECVYKHKSVPIIITNNINDRIIVQFSFVFDLNYDIVLSDFKYNLTGFYEFLDNNEIFKEVYDEIIKYIDERMNKNVRD